MAVAVSTRIAPAARRAGWRVEGFDAVADGFDRAGATAGIRARRALIEHGRRIKETQQELVPTRTRVLRNSIEMTGPDGLGELAVEIGPTKFYATFVEFGTSKMAPRPFVFPALERELPSFMAAMERIAGEVFAGGDVVSFPTGLSGSLAEAA